MNNQNNVDKNDFKVFYVEEDSCWRALTYIGGDLRAGTKIKQIWADGATQEGAIDNLVIKLISLLQQL